MRNAIFKIWASLVLMSLLGGCALVPSHEEKMASFSNQCQTYGFKPQTDAYASCMMKLDADDQRSAAKDAQCSSAAISAGANYFCV